MQALARRQAAFNLNRTTLNSPREKIRHASSVKAENLKPKWNEKMNRVEMAIFVFAVLLLTFV